MNHANNQIERITFKKLVHDLYEILNLKRGILHTLYQTAKNPWNLVSTYLYEDRSKIVNSFRLLIFIVTLSTFISVTFDVNDITFKESVQMNFDSSEVIKESKIDVKSEFMRLMNQNQSMLQFLLVPFLGLFTYLFYKNSGLNLAEQITAQAYFISFNTAVTILLTPLVFYSVKVYVAIPLILLAVYHIWYCLSLPSNRSKVRRIFAAVASISIGYFLYSLIIMFMVGIYIGYKIATEH